MKKTVYSVVLSDEVVAEVDRLAYRHHMSRSAMIDRILAGYVSLTTPEQRITSIFEELSALLCAGDTFCELSPPTPSAVSLRSALNYKYHPTVRYTVELYREGGEEAGVIRVSTRTTNACLLSAMLEFCRMWAKTEARYGFPAESVWENGTFRRPIVRRRSPVAAGLPGQVSEAEMLAHYISLFDQSMKAYFDGLCDGTATGKRGQSGIDEAYVRYLEENRTVV